MRTIVITGKVDSRALVLPLARALSLTGNTCIATEDGAYKRLYINHGNYGNVSGVDIIINPEINDNYVNKIKEGNANYENLIIVSAEYVPTNADSLILCKGVHKVIWEEKEVFEKEDEKAENNNELAVKDDGSNKDEKVSTHKLVEKMLSRERGNVDYLKLDGLIIPKDLKYKEVFISYNKAPVKKALAITLKDGILSYIANCEERKELGMYTEKNYCKTLGTLFDSLPGISSTELISLLNRQSNLEDKKPKK